MLVSADIAVICAVRCSLEIVALKDTNIYIVVSAHITVMCAVQLSLIIVD
jgi:hypothetical protein